LLEISLNEQIDFFLKHYHSFASLEGMPKAQKDKIVNFINSNVNLLLQIYRKNKERFYEAFRNFSLKKYPRYQILPLNRIFILIKG